MIEATGDRTQEDLGCGDGMKNRQEELGNGGGGGD